MVKKTSWQQAVLLDTRQPVRQRAARVLRHYLKSITTKIDRYERKKKRWEGCVSDYKSNLLEQFEVLKSTAQHGLTEQQAETILKKLAQIQAAVLSPEGIIKVE